MEDERINEDGEFTNPETSWGVTSRRKTRGHSSTKNKSMKTANSPFWRRLEGRNLETFFNFPKRFMTDTIILLYVTLHHHRCTTIATTNKRTAKVPGTLDESEMAEGNHPQTITLQSKTAIEQQTTPEDKFQHRPVRTFQRHQHQLMAADIEWR